MPTPTTEQKSTMLDVLLGDRLENCGYDRKDWKRIRDQRSRAQRAIRRFNGDLAWDAAPLFGRIDWDTMSYTAGQSSNEEITNLLRQLINPDCNWVS